MISSAGGGTRLLALADAVYELYAAWKDNPDRNLLRPEAMPSGSTVLGGLIRFEAPLFGEVSYHLYPRPLPAPSVAPPHRRRSSLLQR